jgi:hypothetical protein
MSFSLIGLSTLVFVWGTLLMLPQAGRSLWKFDMVRLYGAGLTALLAIACWLVAPVHEWLARIGSAFLATPFADFFLRIFGDAVSY